MIKRWSLLVLFLFVFLPVFAFAQEVLTAEQKDAVDILWQGKTYTPPFYKGRALWPSQAEVSFVAIVNSKTGLNPKNLYYKWVKNGVVQGTLSGIGNNSYSFVDNGLFQSARVRVDVLSGEALVGRASVEVNPGKPLVLVYENNPLIGYVFENEVSNKFNINKKEVSFTAFPYYFSTFDKEAVAMKYLWNTNSLKSQGGNQVTFRTPDSTSGNSLISIKANSTQKISQSAFKDFLVKFGNENAI